MGTSVADQANPGGTHPRAEGALERRISWCGGRGLSASSGAVDPLTSVFLACCEGFVCGSAPTFSVLGTRLQLLRRDGTMFQTVLDAVPESLLWAACVSLALRERSVEYLALEVFTFGRNTRFLSCRHK